MKLFRWQAPDPYRVAFSTRLDGVSTGPYTSLNLGLLTGDEPDRVVENRRRLCAAVGTDAETAAMAWQVHGARVTRPAPRGIVTPGTPLERCDGLWTDERGEAMVLVTADCFPVALAAADGRPVLAVLHVGWRGLLEGIVEAGARAVGGPFTAAVGPGIGLCCYEVGNEVASPFRRRFGEGVVRDGRLDLRLATERALAETGCASVDHHARCTSCEADLFFSHRRDRGVTGRQGVVAYIA